MARIEFIDDVSGNFSEAQGEKGRLNVNSRSASRAAYNSRNEERTFTLVFDHQGAVAGEFSAYWQNSDTTGRELVISSIGVNAANASRIKLHFVTGDSPTGGTALTPVNMNAAGKHSAVAVARQGDSGDAITGITTAGVVDFLAIAAAGHEEFRLDDRLRLSQGDAIALEYDEGTTGDFFGVIFGYYEQV